MDRITLDREVFKALASDTRLDIMKALDVRQKTVTELAKELGLNKATVFEHLEKLAAVNLIQKLEDDRKWVYWQLSWTGRRLLHPEKITLALLLSTAFGTLLTATAALWMWTRSNLGGLTDGGFDDSSASMPSDASGKESAQRSELMAAPADAPPESAPEQAAQHDPVLLATAVVLGLVFLALLGYAVIVMRRAKLRRTLETA